MSKINIRSPYFITDNSVNGSSPLKVATIFIRIYEGNSSTSISTTPDYTLTATAIDGSVTFEVSELARDYIENNFDGTYTGATKWFNYNISPTKMTKQEQHLNKTLQYLTATDTLMKAQTHKMNLRYYNRMT